MEINTRIEGITILACSAVVSIGSVILCFVDINLGASERWMYLYLPLIVVNLLFYLLGFHYFFCSVKIESGGLYYRPGIFVKYHYGFDEIEYFTEGKNNSYIIKLPTKKITLHQDVDSDGGMELLRYYGVKEVKNKSKEFTVTANIQSKVIGVIAILTPLPLGIWGVASQGGIVVYVFSIAFGILAVFCIWQVFGCKILVDKGKFTVYRFGREPKQYRICDITAVKIKEGGTTKEIYLYIDEKKIGRYTIDDVNGVRFTKLISNVKR